MGGGKGPRDPRSEAARRAGGALYNYWPRDMGPMTVPCSFHVSAGIGRVIAVSGESIETQPPLKQGRRFSVGDVAGVIVGPGWGSSVLYDSQNEMLACFGVSEQNGLVFVQYLRDHGVPFFGLDGEPLLAGDGADGSHSERPRRFVLTLRSTFSLGMWVGLGLLLALVLVSVGLPLACCAGPQMVAPAMAFVLGLSMISIILPWVVGAWKGELFPAELMVDGETIWIVRALHSTRELSLDEIAQLRYEAADVCYVLYDKRGKPLAKFSTQDDFGPQFMEFLKDHNIKPRFDKQA